MYKHSLIGKTLQEARDIIDASKGSYKITRYMYSDNWDTELVVRVSYEGIYHLVTSGFKLAVEDN